jgi:hypothetical protein
VLNATAQRYPINIGGQVLNPMETATYLGFSRSKRSSHIHVANRLDKAKKASFALSSLFRKLPNLKIPIKATIIDQCLAPALLYGTEICEPKAIAAFHKQADKLLRRQGRWLLGAPICAANETVQLDLGWARYETRVFMRQLRFVHRTMQPYKIGTLTQRVMDQAFL